MKEGNKTSHWPFGETPFNPSAVGFQSRWPAPSSSLPITAEPRAPVSTTEFEARQSEMNPAGTASSSGDNSGGDVLFVAGETRQRKQPPARSANSSPLAAKQTRVAQALVARAPGPLLCKSQTHTPSVPAAATHRLSAEKAAERKSGPRSSANSR